MAEESRSQQNGCANGSASAAEKKSVTLSFMRKSTAVKTVRKVEARELQGVELLTAYDDQVAASAGKVGSSRKTIPKLEDTWRPEKKMKNLVPQSDITLQGTGDRFVAETTPANGQADVQYGLRLRERASTEGEDGGVAYRSISEMEDEKLRKDLEELPDEASLDQYESMPVEEFAEALLRGMGWEKGKPIGRRSVTVVEPRQYDRREALLGLGAKPVPPEVDKKILSSGRRHHGRQSETRVSSTKSIATSLSSSTRVTKSTGRRS